MYIGNSPTSQAFVTDYFNGDGSTVAYTMSVAPANSSSIEVIVAGVPQYPNTYSVNSTTLTFSAAPPAGTGNIFVRYLGIPASGVTTTAYRTVTEFTATASQTTFVPPSYTVGYINVYQNGSLLGSADYTATNGTTVVLAVGATVGDLVVVESFYVSSVLNAIPAVNGAVGSTYLANGGASQAFLDSASGTGTGALRLPVGTTAQRPAGAAGLIRQNSTTGDPEWWDSTTSQWKSFSQPAGYTVNYLVVAGGGGGGGAYYSGGGGAGGLLQGTSTLSSGASYPIIIGAGGNGGSTTSVGGVNGSSSTALTLTAIGGGGGGSYSSVAAQSGGSGGGQGGYQFGSVGSGTVGQGYAGGTGALYGGGAGGGAGAVGGNGTTANGGAGGTGASSSISGSATFYAGGGGGGAYGGTGGAGGNGGGGAGASSSGAPSAGTANTGGGGGASSGNTGSYYAGAAGGSGIVVISYFGSQRGSGGTVTSVGGYTIHTFTSSGTYIA